jgi:hypothetical protein
MSTGTAILAWIGLFAGAHVLVLALVLLRRVLRPLQEVKRYADDILSSGVGIAKNLDDVEQAARTRDLVTALPEAVRPVVPRLGPH